MKDKFEKLKQEMIKDNNEGLKRFFNALEHCDKCRAYNKIGTPVCEVCGYELMEHGKH